MFAKIDTLEEKLFYQDDKEIVKAMKLSLRRANAYVSLKRNAAFKEIIAMLEQTVAAAKEALQTQKVTTPEHMIERAKLEARLEERSTLLSLFTGAEATKDQIEKEVDENLSSLQTNDKSN